MFVTLVAEQSGAKFIVDRAIGKMSGLIADIIEDNPDGTEEIPLKVATEPLQAFLEYCEHYKYGKDKTTLVYPLASNKPEEFITDEWERKFIT